MADEFVAAVAATLTDQLREGRAPWLKERDPGEAFLPYNPVTGNAYRGGNAVWLMAAAEENEFSDRRWLTSGQAEKLGGEVLPGVLGTPVQYWKRGTEGHERVLRATVFNADQVEGLPRDDMPQRPVTAERGRMREEFAELMHTLRGEPRGSEAAAKIEMRAEIGSLLLGGHLQSGHQPGHVSYVETWARLIEADPKEVFRAAAEAERMVSRIRMPGLEIDRQPALAASPVEQFADALRDHGFRLTGMPEMDGEMHRVAVEGDKSRERSGAYVGHLDGARPAGLIQNWRTGEKTNWKADGLAREMTAADRAQVAADIAARQAERMIEREAGYERGAINAALQWDMGTSATADHPYLARKGVDAHGLREASDGRLMVPVMDAAGKMQSLQFISPDGEKQFMPGGKMTGGHFIVGDLQEPGAMVIAEGFATAATVHELTDKPVIVAFNAGNLQAVAETYRELHPGRDIYIAGDNDVGLEERGQPNIGRNKAQETAAIVNGIAVLPERGDWNDLAVDRGRDEARINLTSQFAIAGRELLVQEMTAARDRDDDRSQSPAPAQQRAPEKEMESVHER